MSGGPRGTPLDLHAVEARLQKQRERIAQHPLFDDLAALLAHARALRAALLDIQHEMEQHMSSNRTGLERGEFDHLYVGRAWKLAAAVLAAAQDGPAA